MDKGLMERDSMTNLGFREEEAAERLEAHRIVRAGQHQGNSARNGTGAGAGAGAGATSKGNGSSAAVDKEASSAPQQLLGRLV
ncbi:hypothetical protein CBOM_03682 [Ceraceosorus bombacis]|uniref:Uncharacterized protein n=1 Tax=Ceraceosorus bombacis TaxID=401625 RepID=A0A0P1BH37_9BASI|nr:hypothetical protein CBOM_03682 [Ceraceosorus bombacis]